MRIGFASIYSWRPHVEHLTYLASLARDAGHEVHFLTCDANFSTCYSRALRPQIPPWVHCAACRLGGVRSFTKQSVTSIGDLQPNLSDAPSRALEWSESSAATLGRFETDEEFSSNEFLLKARGVEPTVRLSYSAARHWIDRHQLEAMCVFNGRMDATRGVLEAARSAGIPFVTMERTWFGDGLHLVPNENCLSVKSIDAMMTQWRDVPLNRTQALRAARHAASRFLRINSNEWRAYNVSARSEPWPVSGQNYKILLTPGSRTETWGHPDLAMSWPELTAAFDAIIDRLRLKATDVVLRCHPIWSEKIGLRDGSMSERYYTDWANRRGIHVIPSGDTTSTLNLIGLADAVVVCGGSAGLDAGILGKQVIGVVPSNYQQAGFQTRVYSADEVADLRLVANLGRQERLTESERIRRLSLRYCYTMVYRFAQFVPYVRALTTTRYEYYEGADVDRLTRLLATGAIEADDRESSAGCAGEESVLSMIAEGEWAEILAAVPARIDTARRPLRRRRIFRPLDHVRPVFPRGDLMD
jgi:hypothetical protein